MATITHVFLFEDKAVERLAPIALSRPAFTIPCGGTRLIDLVRRIGLPFGAAVRSHLQDLVTADFDLPGTLETNGSEGATLLVNARLVPTGTALSTLRQLVTEGRLGIVPTDGHVAAAVVEPEQLRKTTDPLETSDLTDALAKCKLDALDAKLSLVDYPHDVIRYHLDIFGDQLADRIAGGGFQQTDDGVFLANGASIADFVATDTSAGPIVVDVNAHVGPFASLRGPLYLGPGATVVDHASLKPHVYVGKSAKIGGQVSASIIDAYSNKSHHGYLGHSFLGRWVNLGAGTSNSNLKNTYGSIRMRYGTETVDTRMQFMGCVVGDFTKTAINTSIFTGKTVGACSMLYGSVTADIPSFVNYAGQLGQTTEVSSEVATTTHSRVVQRRNMAMRPVDRQLIETLFTLTASERATMNPPPTSGPVRFHEYR